MPRVAMLTYWYPPNRTMAALRAGKFAKYLPASGWEPVVITVEPGSGLYLRAGGLADELVTGRVHRTRDLSLATWCDRIAGAVSRAAIRPTARIETLQGSPRPLVRAAYRLYRSWLCFPDECWPWRLEYRAIRDLVERERPDVLFSSSPPATAHCLAARLSREIGLPWVAELRDSWSQSHIHVRGRLLRRLEEVLERRTLRSARLLVTVSEPLRQALAEWHGKPVRTVSNGYDEDDLPGPDSGHADRPPPGRLLLVYTGLLYPRERDPELLFAALGALVDEGVVKPEEVVVRFYGRNLGVAESALRRFPAVAGMVEICGEVSYAEALARQHSAHALLLLGSPDPRARGVVTGKLFEYLATGRPVLAVAPRGGDVERILRETGGGVLVTSAPEARAALRAWVEEFRRTDGLGPRNAVRPEALARYTRRRLAGELGAILDEAAAPARPR